NGYALGVFYRRGKFVYWELAPAFQLGHYGLTIVNYENIPANTEDKLSISKIQVPLYIGLNLVPVAHSLVNVRVFAGPSFNYAFSMGDNNFNFTSDDLTKVQVDGLLGVGVDVLFFSVEGGYGLGFSNLLNNGIKSKPTYGFVSLAFKI